MSAHKDHHRVEVGVEDTTAPVTVFFRWAWQAWLLHRLLGVAVGGAQSIPYDERTHR